MASHHLRNALQNGSGRSSPSFGSTRDSLTIHIGQSPSPTRCHAFHRLQLTSPPMRRTSMRSFPARTQHGAGSRDRRPHQPEEGQHVRSIRVPPSLSRADSPSPPQTTRSSSPSHPPGQPPQHPRRHARAPRPALSQPTASHSADAHFNSSSTSSSRTAAIPSTSKSAPRTSSTSSCDASPNARRRFPRRPWPRSSSSFTSGRTRYAFIASTRRIWSIFGICIGC